MNRSVTTIRIFRNGEPRGAIQGIKRGCKSITASSVLVYDRPLRKNERVEIQIDSRIHKVDSWVCSECGCEHESLGEEVKNDLTTIRANVDEYVQPFEISEFYVYQTLKFRV